MDPRLNVIKKRLSDIKRIVAVAGGKGGIGKSTVASMLALVLSKLEYRVGLLDLDFFCPSTHIILGVENVFPEEEKGVIPPKINDIRYMSMIYYIENNALPLRGKDVSNSIIELFTITRWNSLDFLIIDMPPGIGDSTLDIIRFIRKIEFLLLTTSSKLTLETVKKVLQMLKQQNIPILGVLENMKKEEGAKVKKEMVPFEVPFLGKIDMDESLENSLGDIDKLIETNFAKDLKKIVSKKTFEVN